MKMPHRVFILAFTVALAAGGSGAAAMTIAKVPAIERDVLLAKCGPNCGPECGRCKPGQRRECGKDIINGKMTYSCYCTGCPTAGCGK